VSPGTSPAVLHCYFREHLFMTAREVADIRARFVVLAEREGYKLGSIFMEKLETAPTAFRDLLQAASKEDVVAVAVPSMRHLAVVGDPEELRHEVEDLTGARMVLANQLPRSGGTGSPPP